MRTRALIIEKAAETFAKAGYEGASLNDIIRATGLTKGAFYHHFSSKDDLALAVFHAKQSELHQGIWAATGTQPNALLMLREMLRARARLLTGDPSLGCFLRLASELGTRFGPGSDFAASYEAPIRTFTMLVAQGQEEGVFDASLDPEAAAWAVFAAMLGTDELCRALSGGTDLAERTEAWLEVVLAGLAAPGGRAKRSVPHSTTRQTHS